MQVLQTRKGKFVWVLGIFLLGAVLGWLSTGVLLPPVQWPARGPQDLSPGHQMTYVKLVAERLDNTGDTIAAEDALGDWDPRDLEMVIGMAKLSGITPEEARQLDALARALSIAQTELTLGALVRQPPVAAGLVVFTGLLIAAGMIASRSRTRAAQPERFATVQTTEERLSQSPDEARVPYEPGMTTPPGDVSPDDFASDADQSVASGPTIPVTSAQQVSLAESAPKERREGAPSPAQWPSANPQTAQPSDQQQPPAQQQVKGKATQGQNARPADGAQASATNPGDQAQAASAAPMATPDDDAEVTPTSSAAPSVETGPGITPDDVTSADQDVEMADLLGDFMEDEEEEAKSRSILLRNLADIDMSDLVDNAREILEMLESVAQ